MKKLTSKYAFVLVVLTVAILGSQLIMQKTINDSKTDSRVVNVSGRQRMLSQKITKASLKLINAPTEEVFADAKEELKSAVALWAKSHNELKFGSSELNVDEFNKSTQHLGLFDEIEPLFGQMQASSTALLDLSYAQLHLPEHKHVIQSDLLAITENEAEFLRLMNAITYEYDHLASKKIDYLSQVEYILLGITLILILIEVFLVFRPMIVDGKNKEDRINKLTNLLDDKRLFSEGQIAQANEMISHLRKLANGLDEELKTTKKEYIYQSTEQMNKYLTLREHYINLKKSLGQEAEPSL